MSKDKIEKSTEDKIAIRNNWLKIILLLFFSVIIGIKLIYAPFNFDFSDFDFSSLLSLILAVFAIGLSVAFYFKSTDTSNRFYDNTYKFTKDISEILGRIDSGFGERLKHLDEGYSSLRDNFYGTSPKKSNPKEVIKDTESKIDSEKKKLEQEVAERKKIIDELMHKANIGDKEKQKITVKLEEREKEIAHLTRELRMYKRQLSQAQHSMSEIEFRVPEQLKSFLKDRFYKYLEGDFLFDAPDDIIQMELEMGLRGLPKAAVEDLREFRLIEGNRRYRFTDLGLELLKSIARKC